MSKQVILTGLRANTDLHIGNYLGALLPMADMANNRAGEYQINLFLPDLHSFTTPIDHDRLFDNIIRNLKIFVAAGVPIDHDDVYIYRQSYISAHSELTWILNCFTGVGEMNRMTQFKDKSEKIYTENSNIFNEEFEHGQRMFDYPEMKSKQRRLLPKLEQRISVGLFNYPVLMAADILLYDSSYVPVGDDQTQHLEFTRDIAQRMNSKFGELFTVPKTPKEQHEFFGKDQGLRIRDLADPTKKMSKSDETGKGVIFLTDNQDTLRKKVMSATTDSHEDVQYDYDSRPGVSNLLDILELLGGDKQEFIGQNQYGPVKQKVSDLVCGFINEFQEKLQKVDENKLFDKLRTSEAEMNKVASNKLSMVQQALGLRPKS